MNNTSKSIFTISLDFELYWGVRDIISIANYSDSLLKVRNAVPAMLELFEKYEIHATWATVGLMFFESKREMLAGLPAQKPNYANKPLSPYFDFDEVGDNEEKDPYHFAPSLIRKILETPHQELATHTFSHYYCLEQGQSIDEFRDDLKAAVQVAEKYQSRVESIIFPRNQYSAKYLRICREMGIMAFRGNESAWFYESSNRHVSRQTIRRMLRLADAYINISGSNTYSLPRLQEDSPINLSSSRYLRSYSNGLFFLEPLRLNRITSSMAKAASDGSIFHLWWHPEGFCENLKENLIFLEKILIKYKKLASEYGMSSMTMGEIAHQVFKSGI